jgi:hypothetical protein
VRPPLRHFSIPPTQCVHHSATSAFRRHSASTTPPLQHSAHTVRPPLRHFSIPPTVCPCVPHYVRTNGDYQPPALCNEAAVHILRFRKLHEPPASRGQTKQPRRRIWEWSSSPTNS